MLVWNLCQMASDLSNILAERKIVGKRQELVPERIVLVDRFRVNEPLDVLVLFETLKATVLGSHLSRRQKAIQNG